MFTDMACTFLNIQDSAKYAHYIKVIAFSYCWHNQVGKFNSQRKRLSNSEHLKDQKEQNTKDERNKTSSCTFHKFHGTSLR